MSKSTGILAVLCLITISTAFAAAKPLLPSDALRVPLVRQATDYSCGAAALASILYYWKVFDGNESSLYALLETTPNDGTEPAKLVEGARSFGLDARMQENLSIADLQSFLSKGFTVIVDLQAWDSDRSLSGKPWKDVWESGHYVVLVGLDQQFANLT
ncbi:C39 family peptidase [Bdellovibrionota bacterium FG-1]